VAIRNNVRKSDLVVRYGGEEIALLMPNTPLAVAADFAERIRNQIAEAEHRLGSESVSVTVNAGVAVLGVKMNDMNVVMKAADKALLSQVLIRSNSNGFC
jgi:diguanylate cyclase